MSVRVHSSPCQTDRRMKCQNGRFRTSDWVRFRDRIKAIDIRPGVTSIGMNAFDNLKQVERITLPETLTTIYSSPFDFDYSYSETGQYTELRLPQSLQEVNKGGLAIRADVTYAGSAEDWSQVRFTGMGWSDYQQYIHSFTILDE